MSTLQKGDIIQVRVPDDRWWPRFTAWVLRRPPPMKTELLEIGETLTSELVTFENQAVYVSREVHE